MKVQVVLGNSKGQSREETLSAHWLSYPRQAAYDNALQWWGDLGGDGDDDADGDDGSEYEDDKKCYDVDNGDKIESGTTPKMQITQLHWINDKAIFACSVQISFYVAGVARNSVLKNCSKSTQIVTNTLQGAFTVVILFVTSPSQNIPT